MRRCGAGFTLIEVLVSIALVGLLVGVLGPTIIGQVNNGRVNRLARELSALEKAAEKWLDLTGKVDYTGLSIGDLSTKGIIPSELAGATANPWKCEYAIYPTSSDPKKLRIAARCVPTWVESAIRGMFGQRASVARDTGDFADTTWLYTTF